MQGKARVLIYGFTAEEGQLIDAALASVGVPRTTKLRPSQGHVVLSEIILHDREGEGGFACPERLVLFHNLSDGGIRTLIPYIRKLDIPRPIFAVVTETSYRWTLAELLEHLVEEKRAFEKRSGAPSGEKAQSPPEEPGAAEDKSS